MRKKFNKLHVQKFDIDDDVFVNYKAIPYSLSKARIIETHYISVAKKGPYKPYYLVRFECGRMEIVDEELIYSTKDQYYFSRKL